MSNSLIKTLGNGVQVELISQQTQLFYDPTTQQARVIFNGVPCMLVASEHGPAQYVQVGDEIELLHVDLADKFADQVAEPDDVDPVTNASLANISVAGIALLLKRAYRLYYNHNAQADSQESA